MYLMRMCLTARKKLLPDVCAREVLPVYAPIADVTDAGLATQHISNAASRVSASRVCLTAKLTSTFLKVAKLKHSSSPLLSVHKSCLCSICNQAVTNIHRQCGTHEQTYRLLQCCATVGDVHCETNEPHFAFLSIRIRNVVTRKCSGQSHDPRNIR
jgi:hypothetical protein